MLLLGVEVDDELLVDVLGNLLAGGDIQELTAQVGSVELQPGLLGGSGNAVGDNLEALGALANGDHLTGLHLAGRDVANNTIQGDVAVQNQLTGGSAGRGKAQTVHQVVQTGFQEEDEVFTGLTLHTGSAAVGVTELTLQHTVHVLHFLLLLELGTILLLLFTLSSQTMLSGRGISLFKGLVRAIDGLAELTGDAGGRTSISCHDSSSLIIKLYGGP